VPKNNEYDLLLAIMEVGRADTVPTDGLTDLTGKTVPIIRWQDRTVTGNEPPIVAIAIVSATPSQGAPEKLFVTVQFDAIVERGSEGLEARIADRILEVMTVQNFAAESLDVAVDLRQRRSLDGLEEGRRRLSMDVDMAMKR